MMDYLKYFIVLNLFFNSFTFAATVAGRKLIKRKKQPTINVLIGKELKSVLISGFDLKRKFHTNKSTKQFEGRKSIKFNCLGFLDRNSGKLNKPLLLASLKSSTGLLTVNKNKYQGELLVVASHNESSCDLVNQIPLENYLSSLLAKEMNSSWHIEALKAQAVAARSYALHKIDSQQVSRGYGYDVFYDLESSEKHQVAGSFLDTTRKTEIATRLTRGQVLVDNKGKLKPIFFHASCGGKTLKPSQVWVNRVHGYEGVSCRYCLTNKKRRWNKGISQKRFNGFLSWASRNKYLKKDLPKNKKKWKKVRIASDRFKNRQVRMYIGRKQFRIEKNHLRRYFGRVVMPSNFFKFIKTKQGYVAKGQGNGHGVGMCQVGAFDLARRGWGYKKILAHYFPNFRLKKNY
jgi:stage II sporulation protein D